MRLRRRRSRRGIDLCDGVEKSLHDDRMLFLSTVTPAISRRMIRQFIKMTLRSDVSVLKFLACAS